MSEQQWTVYSQRSEAEREAQRQREAAEAAAWREAEEKARWIAQRRAEDRLAARKKLLWLLTAVLFPALLLGALVLLGIPGYHAVRASDAAQAGNYRLAAEEYGEAAGWGLYNALFRADAKAAQNAELQRRATCTAGVPDSQIPKGAVKLSSTGQRRSGPITVELIADARRIYRVSVTEHSELDEIGGEAARVMPERIYRAQSADVDAVTGATISSQAICRAVSQALSSDEAWVAGIYPWNFGALPAMPSPSPTQGPRPEELKVFYYETELEEFTEKVGETVRLRAVAYPEAQFEDAVYRWEASDKTVLKLSVSDSTRECVVLCLTRQPGPATVTVECNGVTREIKVYTKD